MTSRSHGENTARLIQALTDFGARPLLRGISAPISGSQPAFAE
jgi:hypothetical protein